MTHKEYTNDTQRVHKWHTKSKQMTHKESTNDTLSSLNWKTIPIKNDIFGKLSLYININ